MTTLVVLLRTYDMLLLCLATGFSREINMNYVLLGYFTESNGNSLPTFRDNQLVSSSVLQNPSRNLGPIGCPETSTWSYHHSLCNSPEERRSHALTFSFVAKKKCYIKMHL